MSDRYPLVAGALFAGLGVVLGAFGAHALEGAVAGWGLSEAEQAQRLTTWEVAVRYQMYHSLALLVVGLLAARRPSQPLALCTALFIWGMLIFCGCLYAFVLTGIKMLGAVVPLGGVFLIAAWAVFAWATGRAASGEESR